MGDFGTFMTLVTVLLEAVGFFVLPFLGGFLSVWLLVRIATEARKLLKASRCDRIKRTKKG